MLSKDKIVEKHSLTPEQSYKIEQYIYEINEYNSHTNIVGKSTLVDPWNSHISDSIQICNLIHNKKINNKTALSNPECLEEYKNIEELSDVISLTS